MINHRVLIILVFLYNMKEDLRKIVSNYNIALTKLTEAVEYIHIEFENVDEVLEEIIKEGLIQRFEYPYEMAWNVMKNYALYQGIRTLAALVMRLDTLSQQTLVQMGRLHRKFS